jgi:hypothetical protein
MKTFGVFLLVVVLAAAAPFVPSASIGTNEGAGADFPGWPQRWEGKPLQRLPLSEREQRFAAGFPGRMARFSNGERQLIVRWLHRETRQLHPASDCFRGSGYNVTQAPLRTDADGLRWGCFDASRAGESLTVCERIFEQDGASWTDVSAWYWAAALGRTHGPWWAVTVTERRRRL